MRGCHRCGHAGDIANGKYAGTPWEETPCAACTAGRYDRALCFEEEIDMELDEDAARAVSASEPGPEGGDGCRLGVDVLPVGVLAEFVRGLLTLPPKALEVVCMRYQGWTYAEIAAAQGVSVGAVELRHRRVLERWPVWRALCGGKLARRRKRGPAEQEGIRDGGDGIAGENRGRDAPGCGDAVQ